MNFKPALLIPLVAIELAATSVNAAPWVVHEWGTFTSLQNEKGEAIGGINTDDEPVPRFVHRLADFLLLTPTEVPTVLFQGAPKCHPDVTMRLETPVIYFHPPPEDPSAYGVTVTATFHGGWLSEYYPDANTVAPGIVTNQIEFGRFGVDPDSVLPAATNKIQFGPLLSSTTSTLCWSNLDLGGTRTGPDTSEHVWTSPRAVNAATVRNASGEAEKFLFYRGVAHIDAPIAITRDGAELTLRSQCPPEISAHAPLNLKSLWLVDIETNGKIAFRALPPVTLANDTKELAKVSSNFAPGDYTESNRDQLKSALHAALMAEGLFDDEAQALLNTWELSYFKSAGLRVFFLVPRAWTDFYLPLKIAAPMELTRVMVGRIELVTPAQRETLRALAQISPSEMKSDLAQLGTNYLGQIHARSSEDQAKVNAGRESLADFGVTIPRSYQLYLGLGRFRNALILDEAAKHPAPGLDNFISTYNLQGYKLVALAAAAPAQSSPKTRVIMSEPKR